MEPFFTIGHSTRAIEAFTGLLAANGVTRLVDVRTVPKSRMNPQYNRDALPKSLAAHGIAYQHMPALGGLRPRMKDVPPERNGFWENQSFHNYADYAMGPEFRAGLESLIELGRRERCAVMCAEAVWWQCHRMLLSDALVANDIDVRHILGPKSVQPHRLTPFAQIGDDRQVHYPGLV
jgi:uncharacterized protein (DUF488 family)